MEKLNEEWRILRNLFINSQTRIQEQTINKSKSAQKFWQRIMNECVRRRFLASKQNQAKDCAPITNFAQYRKCMVAQKQKLKTYMLQMQFYQAKYETCIEEGLRARYPLSNVEIVCGNKIIRFIRGNNEVH